MINICKQTAAFHFGMNSLPELTERGNHLTFLEITVQRETIWA